MRCVCGHTAHEHGGCPCGCSLYEPDDGTYGPRHLYPIQVPKRDRYNGGGIYG